ncbi:MAG: DUF2062 domain-containing protein [Verrucomicrobiaceae bacterium]|nr:MAG: DUF2062 domain-containing protein [Verrucomicrobiaceae bacterium]
MRPLVQQLRQGTSPDKLGWTIGSGVALGLFPIFGTRGWLCFFAGIAFKLNQPLLHTFKGLIYPLHLATIIPFIQMGQWIYGKEPLRISIEVLKDEFELGFGVFLHDFGWVVLRAATAWLLVAPVVLVVVKYLTTPALRGLVGKLKRSKADGPD